ncbi:unnamed protein product [Peniophora sp. CBMAI 1063]|nr:unnamed protein product [Peniophora sp. CBMAI 1063]
MDRLAACSLIIWVGSFPATLALRLSWATSPATLTLPLHITTGERLNGFLRTGRRTCDDTTLMAGKSRRFCIEYGFHIGPRVPSFLKKTPALGYELDWETASHRDTQPITFWEILRARLSRLRQTLKFLLNPSTT